MRILVLGAGGVGGYFGGRLLEAGVDVTFLVRPRRARQLAREGIVIHSPFGDARLPATIVASGDIDRPYDFVLICCKAYHIDQVLTDIAPAIGADTFILPLLNGVAHLDLLDKRFGRQRVLGGSCHLSVALTANGHIEHANRLHRLTFGWRAGLDSQQQSSAFDRFSKVLSTANFDAQASGDIVRVMWEKFTLLSSLAGLTCLMRGDTGAIVATCDGRSLLLQLLEECIATATAAGHEPAAEAIGEARTFLTQPGAATTSSMLRDIEKGSPTEADHILGDMLSHAHSADLKTPLLRAAYCHLQVYETIRASGLSSARTGTSQ